MPISPCNFLWRSLSWLSDIVKGQIMPGKVNREFGNILRKNKNTERGIQYSSYVKLREEIAKPRVSIHNRFKTDYGTNYMQQWR